DISYSDRHRMDDSIYFSLSLQSKITILEKEKAEIKEELEKNSNTFAVCLAIKNGKIKQLESAITAVTDEADNKCGRDTQIETPSLRLIITSQMNIPKKDWTINQCFAISPSHDLPLIRLGDSTRLVGIIVVQNTSTRSLMFKVKAESQEKFFIFPSRGKIVPGETEIMIVIAHVKNEDPFTFKGEKIELRAIQNDSTNFDEFRELWSQTAQERRAKHDLFCMKPDINSDLNIARKRSITIEDRNGTPAIQEEPTTMNECDQLKIRILEVEAELVNSKSQSDEFISIIRVLQEENAESTKTMEILKRKMEVMKRTLQRYGHFSDF
ncbi:hypothetical protein PRIPAC_83524, partial [Pristionchus pacificus]